MGLLFLMQKRAFCSTSASPSASFTARYLMESCGLSSKSAHSASHKLKLDQQDLQKPDSVITFFKSHGFKNSHISKLVEQRPKILNYQVDENLKPKIEYLVQNGFSGHAIPDLVAKNPAILTQSLTSSIIPAIAFLMAYLKTNEMVVKAVKRSPWLLSSDLKSTMQPNVDVLINEGLPVDGVAKLILMQPSVLIRREGDRMASVVQTVKELGVEPTDPMYIHAVRVVLCMSESSWKMKVEIFQGFGWTEEEASSVFRRNPHCFAFSKEKLKSTLDFYTNTVKLTPEIVIGCPKLLEYPIDERMRRKYNVLKVLVEKKLLREDTNIGQLLLLNEGDFLKKYVTRHLELVPGLARVYEMARDDV